jgi:hypothetical protein
MPTKRPNLQTTPAGTPIPWVAMSKHRSHTGCLTKKLCWICGVPLGVHLSWVTPVGNAFALLAHHAPAHLTCAELMQEQQLKQMTLLWTARAPLTPITRFDDGITNTFAVIMPTPERPPVWRHPSNDLVTRQEALHALTEAFNEQAKSCQSAEELIALQDALRQTIDQFTPAT